MNANRSMGDQWSLPRAYRSAALWRRAHCFLALPEARFCLLDEGARVLRDAIVQCDPVGFQKCQPGVVHENCLEMTECVAREVLGIGVRAQCVILADQDGYRVEDQRWRTRQLSIDAGYFLCHELDARACTFRKLAYLRNQRG